MATINFDANQVAPSVPFEAIPAGKYQAIIVDSVEKPTKAGNGSYLQFEFEIIEGEAKGKKVWARLNIKNSNAQTVAIARADLSAICRAVGVMTPRDSVELHNLPLTIDVRCEKNRNDEIVNTIKGYAPRQSPAAIGGVAKAVTNDPPWARKTH